MTQPKRRQTRSKSKSREGLPVIALVALLGRGLLKVFSAGGGARSTRRVASSRRVAASRRTQSSRQPPSRPRRTKTAARVARRRSVAALVTTVMILAGILGSAAAANAGQVLNGITVGGIAVEGLQGPQVVSKLSPVAGQISNRPLKLGVGKRSWIRTPAQLGITVDVKRTAGKAMHAGRDGPFGWFLHLLGAKQEKLSWSPKIDRTRLDASLDELSRLVKVEPSNGNVSLENADVKVQPPSEGVELLPGAARQELVKASLQPPKNNKVALPVTITDPEIGLEEAEKIKQKAKAILAEPAEFVVESKQFVVSPPALAQVLKVMVVDEPKKAASLELRADANALREQIGKLGFQSTEPKDASFSVAGDGVRMNPSTDGKTVDTEAGVASVLQLGEKREPIPLPLKVVPAKFNTEAAAALGIKSKISSFTTFFDPENAPRVANIDRMASAINGKVLKPGDSYSLNSSTGKRTTQNGYQEAQVIKDGELVPGIGGGVCQVATTLFNAVFTAGLQVIERGNHSLHISKYPMGRDAMVNFGTQDLRFKNDTSFGMLLKASVTPKALTVSIYSTPLGRTVQTTTSDQRNPSAPTTKFIDDPALPAGAQVVSEEGKPGFDVTVTRRVVSAGKVLHDDTFVSKYKAWKRIVRKGTGPAAPVVPGPAPAPADAPPPAPAPPIGQ